jgi:hypothetical protein
MENHMKDETILEALLRAASITPPAWLDRKMLKRIRRKPILRPFLAVGLSVASLVAITAWLATGYAQTRIADQAALAAAATVLAYLAFCSVTLVPVLMLAKTSESKTPLTQEVPS